MRLLSSADYREMHWRNGGGTTTELHVEGGRDDGFDWRVSIARIQSDGPFSRFSGYDRHIMTLEGEGLVLEGGPDGPVEVYPSLTPRFFSGDWPITGRLRAGPAVDFNLMARRDAFRSSLAVLEVTAPAVVHAGAGVTFLYLLSGACRGGGQQLAVADAVLLEEQEELALEPTTAPMLLAVCRLQPLCQR